MAKWDVPRTIIHSMSLLDTDLPFMSLTNNVEYVGFERVTLYAFNLLFIITVIKW